jgi:aminopeptidase N
LSANCEYQVGSVVARTLLIVSCLTLVPSLVEAAGHAVPLTLSGEVSPWTNEHSTKHHRILEAETKARRMMQKEFQLIQASKASPLLDLYDVQFYDLDLDFQPGITRLDGTVLIRAEVLATSMNTMVLNLDLNMYIPEARSDGVIVTYSRSADVLTVNLDRTYLQGEILSVEIEYYGNPSGAGFGWASYNSEPLIWTLSEPYGAREWWPCKDLNTDKADSVSLHVTVPENLVVASNGSLEQITVPSIGKKTYHWTERYAIAPYLVSVTAHPYAVFYDEYVSAANDTMPLEYYVVQDRLAQSMAAYAVVPEMITAFAGLFGEYPFLNEKYGHAHFLWGGGMEHQTCSSMTLYNYSSGLIAHELAHQWFGNMITCADFGHIWINEGWATWSEAYWREQNEGIAAYHDEMDEARYMGPGTIFVEDPNNFNSIFNYSLSYQKASWVPHMLRHVVGETDFLAGIAELRSERGFAGATTEDLQAAFEVASGKDLSAFFQQWIYGEYFPAYRLAWNTAPDGGQSQVNIKVDQIQGNTGLFTMPLDVRVTTDLGMVDFVIQNSEAEEWYDFSVTGVVLNVELDPDNWVLRTVEGGGVSAVDELVDARTSLQGNAPNPFNPTTMISYRLGVEGDARLEIFDIAGRFVKSLVAESLPAGDHQTRWNGNDEAGRSVASGTYFARLQSGGLQYVQSMVLVR